MQPKLFMILLGSKAPERNVEQHDYFFGIGSNLKDLVPAMRNFWPEAGDSIHIDGWREVTQVDGFDIQVVARTAGAGDAQQSKKLFFINLGGYQSGKLEEQHYTLLGVHDDRTQAIQAAKNTIFFRTNTIKGAGSHIDEKYGIDVDDIYRIEDVLAPEYKDQFHLIIQPSQTATKDAIHLGYLKLGKIK